MNRSIVMQLVAKDLYLYRWMIVAAVLVGAVSVPFMGGSGVSVGLVLFMTNIIAFGIFLVMYGVLKERQERSLLFVLSLPVSPMQYTWAKVLAGLIGFLLPWAVLTLGIVALMAWSPETPDGRIPGFVALMAFFLGNFCLLLAIALVATSERWIVAGILVTNMSVPLFLGTVLGLPGIEQFRGAEVAVWTPTALLAIAAPVLLSLVSIGGALLVQSRRRDVL